MPNDSELPVSDMETMTIDIEDGPTFDSTPSPLRLPAQDSLALLVLSGPAAGRYVRMSERGGTIGRHNDNTVAIEDRYVSRNHAKIERNPKTGWFEVHDLDSHYGVFVEGVQVVTRELLDGQRIQLSDHTVLRVRYEDQDESELWERMQHAALTDPLTELPNRRYFLKRLEEEFSYARRHKTELAMLVIDIDRFKLINDAHGHHVGDHAVRHVARVLNQTSRQEDVVARLGGDEFVILTRGYGIQDTMRFSDRLCQSIEASPLFAESKEIPLTSSVGAANFNPMNVKNSRGFDLFVQADAALYASKQQGRNRSTHWALLERTNPQLLQAFGKNSSTTTMDGTPPEETSTRDN